MYKIVCKWPIDLPVLNLIMSICMNTVITNHLAYSVTIIWNFNRFPF